MPQISLTVNGIVQTHEVEPRTLLVKFLREHCGLTGAHVGCDTTQCGYCTPGMIMQGVDIVRRGKACDERTIRHELEGNLCRCTGYQNIVEAIADVAQRCPESCGAPRTSCTGG